MIGCFVRYFSHVSMFTPWKASSDGNNDLFNGLQNYNVDKANQCSSYGTSTKDTQDNNALFMRSLKSGQSSARDDVFQMGECVDEAAMDELFERACCGRFGYDAWSILHA